MADYNSCTSGAVTLSSIDARCDGSVGGIKRILIANRDDVTATIGTDSNELQYIDSITVATGKKFEQWRFRKNTGSYTSTLSTDPAIGNNTVTTEVTLQFSKAEVQKRLLIQTAINANAVVIIEDMYGKYVYLGLENEVSITAATMQSGTATGDLSGFTLTFQDIATELPHFVDDTKVNIENLLVAAQ